MIRISSCPICDGAPAKAWPALVAPFIAELALKEAPSTCALLECGHCAFRFFDGRFEPPELERLYSGYRGEAYFEVRHRLEPWYSRRHNEGTGHAPEGIAERKAYLGAFLRERGLGSVQRVLDYGGDSGQFIPDGIGAELHVYEVSDAAPVAGVRKITDERELEAGGYDLVLLNHVLEHVPEPVPLVRKLASLLKPGSGALYVEVPFERYRIWSGRGGAQRAYLGWLARHGGLLRGADFLSTLCRVALGTVPPLGFPKLHEHINFFGQASIGEAFARSGLAMSEFRTAARTDGRIISALARRGPDPISAIMPSIP